MTTIAITIPGKPLPKGRPRVVNGRAYTDPKTRAYESRLRAAFVVNAHAHRWVIPAGDVVVDIVLRFGSGIHGDVDNCAKAILDAANGVLYRDDRQIRRLTVERVTTRTEEGFWLTVSEAIA